VINQIFDLNKDLLEFDIAMCDNQGWLFEDCEYDFACNAFDFINAFMNSYIAAEMDTPLSFWQICGIKQIGEALMESVKLPPRTGERKNTDALYWIGYMYRYWACLGEKSNVIIQHAPVEQAYMMYPGYHTLAVPEAIRMFLKPKVHSTEIIG